MTIKLKELMVLERILLEFDVKYKFELDFDDAYKLYTYLNKVGKITSYAFLIQNEFHEKYNDTEKLKEYHNKIMDSVVYFNYGDIVKFIGELNEKFKDEKIASLILNNAFWA